MKPALIAGLALLSLGLLIYILLLKRQIRQIIEALRRTQEYSYNKQITLDLFDRSTAALAAELNHMLDYQRQLKRESVQAEQTLRQSVSDIAHDLRTPMTVIKGNLQLLSLEQLTAQGSEYLKICQEKTDALKDMADAFFEMSVLESSSTPITLQPVDLTKVLMQFLTDHEAVIRMHQLEPELRFPEKTVSIMADEQLLLRMLGNLLQNILKYADGWFRLTLEQAGQECRIIFENPIRSGQNPDPEKIFERSYRADTARSGGSAGLGLYIVRLLAEKQNAVVSAAAEEGALTLTVCFPAAHYFS